MATSPFQPPVFAPFLVIFLVPVPQVTQFLECPTKAWAGAGGGGGGASNYATFWGWTNDFREAANNGPTTKYTQVEVAINGLAYLRQLINCHCHRLPKTFSRWTYCQLLLLFLMILSNFFHFILYWYINYC